MHPIPRAAVVCLACVAALTTGAHSTGVHQQTATITVDFLATGSDGQPVPNLAPTEITFRVGGRDLAVQSVEMITLGVKDRSAPDDERGAAVAPGVPPPFGVTRPVMPRRGRNILLLLDEGTLFSVDQIVRDSVARLVESLAADDRLALVSTRPGSVSLDFTTRHDTIRSAMDALVLGRGNTALCVGSLINQIRDLAESLPKGRTTTLALISRGAGSGPSSIGPLVSGAGNCAYRREELAPVAQAVSAAQINYHVFHVGSTGLGANLDNFAGVTGAETGILSWTDAEGIARAVRSSSRYYRATVDAPTLRNEYERAELRVTRPNVKVQGPQHIRAEPARPPLADAATLLRGDLSRADLPLRVAAFPSRNSGPQPLKIVVVVEPAGVKPLLSAIVSVVGSDGEVAGQWTARRADLAHAPLVTAIPVNKGTYRVRAAAVDEDGRGGIAEYSVNAALEGSGPVKLSAIALGVSTPNGFSPRLQFGNEPEAIAYLEVYEGPATGRVSASFEVATTADGPPTLTVPGQASGSGALLMFTAALPLTRLQVGDTVIRARVTVDGEVAGTVVRMLRKVR